MQTKNYFMKKLLLINFTLLLLSVNNFGQNIAAVRGMALGNNVTVRGVVTNGNELGIIRYMQDNSGGIAIYGGNVSTINRGDSIIATGPLVEFRNLYEVTPVTFTVFSTPGKMPNPMVITPSQFDESKEGILLQIKNCVFSASGSFGAVATNYTVTSGGQTFVVRSNTTIAGAPIPTGTVDITGVGSQFCATPASGCTTGYQFLVRDMSDIVASGSIPTGIIYNLNSNQIDVYPNPTNSSISFKLLNNEIPTSIIITDMTGKMVYSSNISQTSISTLNFAKGVYHLQVITTSNNYKTNFIVD